MMRGKAFLNQCLVFGCEGRFVQFESTADNELALLDGEPGQFFKNLVEAHGRNVTDSKRFVSQNQP